MTAYFIRRLLLVIPTFLGITIMVFTITRFVPGGPIERIIAETRAMQMGGQGGTGSSARAGAGSGQPLSREQMDQLKAYYGFDKPLVQSYLIWLGKVLQGDLSLYFGGLSLVLIYGVCIPLGLAKAVLHKSGFDNISSVVIFTGYAIPGWVAGVLMLVLFASHYDVFPLGGLVSDRFDQMGMLAKIADIARHTVLPLIAYVIGSFTVMTLLMKNTLMDNLSADYVRTAIAKGLSFKRAVFRHAMRNSLIPIATSFGNNISILLMGSFLIEKVFNIDGMGLLGYESVVDRDYPVVMGILVISSLLFMIGNILSDVCVAIVDPRVRFG